jgi:HSP20 family protein
MPIIIRSLKSTRPSQAVASPGVYRRPHYDCQEQMDALKLVVYVPGVDHAAVEIKVHGPDLIVTAPKSHLVRANWRAAHLELVQRDYQLRLRLGFSLNYDELQSALRGDVLTITIPKRVAVAAVRGAA